MTTQQKKVNATEHKETEIEMKDKTAIITGGTRGIGLAIAKELAKSGANLILTYRGNDDAAKVAEDELRKYSGNVSIIKSDVAIISNAEKIAKTAVDAFGHVDILVNNAGITKDKLLARMSQEDFTSVIDTNLGGAFNMMKAVSSYMMKQRSGRIINVSSIAGVKGNPGQINYSASKAGLIGMTLSAAKELGSRGITVNAVAPGYIETEMTNVLTDSQKENMNAHISLRRPGQPEDVAKTVRFLASQDASYITGQVIGIDGGMNI
jgi:3-oxoacyl-[acyl-carrier protein] reductase